MIVAGAVSGRMLRYAAVLLLVAALLLYPAVLQSLSQIWRNDDNPTYSHGFLIAAVCMWMLWRGRADLLRVDAALGRHSWRVLCWPVLILAVLLWQLMYRAGIQVGYLFLWPLIIWAAIGAGIGIRAAVASALGLAMLYFAIPLWDFIGPLAQWTTVYAVRAMLRIVDVPAFFEGNLVHIPAGTFEIQGGCSGLSFIIVGLAMGTILGELRHDRWQRRVQWLVLALLLAVLTNWIRVFVIIVAGHLTHMQSYLVRVSHYGFGWVLFAVAMAVLLLIERRAPLKARVAATSADAATLAAGSASMWTNVAAAMIVIALPTLLNMYISGLVASQRINLQPVLAGWQPIHGVEHSWRPVQTLTDGESLQRFTRDGQQVDVYLAWYEEQRQRKKLGGYGNRLSGEEAVVESGLVEAGGMQFGTMRTRSGQRQALIWYQYRVDDRAFVSATRAQLWYSWRSLLGLSTPLSSVIALRVGCDGDCAAAANQLRQIAAHIGTRP